MGAYLDILNEITTSGTPFKGKNALLTGTLRNPALGALLRLNVIGYPSITPPTDGRGSVRYLQRTPGGPRDYQYNE